ncbi:MAG: ABC transporter permease [Bacteroidaceae bacterium]|nr:ABC transporter permease [Bacteroidaceae bacterium]
MKLKDSGVLAIACREIGRMVSRPLYGLSMILAPLFCYIFFTTLMKEGLPQELPAGVVDEDNSSVSRNILRNLDAYQQTAIVRQYSSFADAREAMQRGEIYGFFHIPRGLEHDASSQNQPQIAIYTNSTYLIPSSLLYRDMKTMAVMASAGVGRQVLIARGAGEDQAMGFLQPIKMDMHALGNPYLNYSVYLSNTLLPAILVLLVLMITCFSIHTEGKDGTAAQWMDMAGGSVLKAVSGKLLPQTLLFSLMALVYLVILYCILGFPHENGIWPMALASFLLILSSQGFAVFIASAIPSLRWSLSLCTLWGVLSIPISGFSFPVMGMPDALQALSYLFPLRYYFLIYVDQALNGIQFFYSAWFYVALVLFMLMPLTDIWLLKKTAYKYTYLE